MPNAEPAVVVLLGEPDVEMRVTYAHLLKGLGHHVLESADSLELLALAASRVPDIIVFSLQLPGLCGPALCRV